MNGGKGKGEEVWCVKVDRGFGGVEVWKLREIVWVCAIAERSRAAEAERAGMGLRVRTKRRMRRVGRRSLIATARGISRPPAPLDKIQATLAMRGFRRGGDLIEMAVGKVNDTKGKGR